MKQYKRNAEGISSQTKWLIGGGIAAVAGLGFFAILIVVLIVKNNDSNDHAKTPAPTTARARIIFSQPTNTSIKMEADEKVDEPNSQNLVEPVQPDLNIQTSIPESRELDVMTSIPPVAVPGNRYQFQITTKDTADNITFRLVSGPKGLTINARGLVVWNCPKDYKGSAKVAFEYQCNPGPEGGCSFIIRTR